MPQSINPIEAAAADFGRHSKGGGGWALGLAVAACVKPNTGSGGSATARSTSKISSREFARQSGTSDPRVMNYYRAWVKAHEDGLVVHPDDLNPADWNDVDYIPEAPWTEFYAGNVGSRVTEASVERQVREDPAIAAAAVRGLDAGGLDHVEDPGVEKLVHRAARTRPTPTSAAINREVLERIPEQPFDTPPVIPNTDTTWMDVDRALGQLHSYVLMLEQFTRDRRDVVEPRAWRIESEADQLHMIAAAARGLSDGDLAKLLDSEDAS